MQEEKLSKFAVLRKAQTVQMEAPKCQIETELLKRTLKEIVNSCEL